MEILIVHVLLQQIPEFHAETRKELCLDFSVGPERRERTLGARITSGVREPVECRRRRRRIPPPPPRSMARRRGRSRATKMTPAIHGRARRRVEVGTTGRVVSNGIKVARTNSSNSNVHRMVNKIIPASRSSSGVVLIGARIPRNWTSGRWRPWRVTGNGRSRRRIAARGSLAIRSNSSTVSVWLIDWLTCFSMSWLIDCFASWLMDWSIVIGHLLIFFKADVN